MEILIGVVAFLAVVAVIAVLVLRRRRSGAVGPRGTDRPSLTVPSDERAVRPPLRIRLGRTRSTLAEALGGVFNPAEDVAWESLEDALILADVGQATASQVVAGVRSRHPESTEEALAYLGEELRGCFAGSDRRLSVDGSPAVVVVVGVNGAGKTTTIGKLARDLTSAGASVILAAADTFRAAADTQLIAWGERAGIDVVSGTKGQDPASVAFAAIDKARSTGTDVVIVDTAGRLHGHTNLMDELGKIVRVAAREAGDVGEVLLVLDGSTGQNGLAQARAFTEAVGVTGVALTKLDGTAKGGVAVAVERELGIPIKYIGVGEGIDDLVPFDPDEFVDALIAP